MNSIKNHGTEHSAKYLVLLVSETAGRALLFGQDHCFLAELIDEDDGVVLDNLMRTGTACSPPCEVAARVLVCNPTGMQCFALN